MGSDPDGLAKPDELAEELRQWRKNLLGNSLANNLASRRKDAKPFILVRCSLEMRKAASKAAKQVGLPRETWARGILAMHISDALGIPLEELLEGGPSMRPLSEE